MSDSEVNLVMGVVVYGSAVDCDNICEGWVMNSCASRLPHFRNGLCLLTRKCIWRGDRG